MHRYRLVLAVLIPILFSENAYSQDLAQPDYDKCVGRPGIDNLELAKCGTQRVAAQEAQLDKAWKDAQACLHSLSENYPVNEEKKNYDVLIEEQDKWVAYKDKACEFWHWGLGREGRVINAGACKANVIAERTKFLNSVVQLCP